TQVNDLVFLASSGRLQNSASLSLAMGQSQIEARLKPLLGTRKVSGLSLTDSADLSVQRAESARSAFFTDDKPDTQLRFPISHKRNSRPAEHRLLKEYSDIFQMDYWECHQQTRSQSDNLLP